AAPRPPRRLTPVCPPAANHLLRRLPPRASAASTPTPSSPACAAASNLPRAPSRRPGSCSCSLQPGARDRSAGVAARHHHADRSMGANARHRHDKPRPQPRSPTRPPPPLGGSRFELLDGVGDDRLGEPAKFKAFIDRVNNTPLHDIAIPVSGFCWEFNKGNFHHWRPLFMHFDTYFKTCISSSKDLLLSDDMTECEPLMQILRVMQIVLEDCQNKTSFAGLEHFKNLLASSDPEVLVAALETLASVVKINPSKLHINGKLSTVEL
uniref:DUF908 domain-containing protein n=5 Tax=Aegilops tauschii subsp. strangulata TaxID=200361 RepID=A0A452XNT5_AEGTS